MACTSASRDDRQKLRVTVVGIEDERAAGCNFDGRLPDSSVSNTNLRRGRCFDVEIYCPLVYGRNLTSSVTGCHIFCLSNRLILCVTQGKVSNSGMAIPYNYFGCI
jgi:hypothetical protein